MSIITIMYNISQSNDVLIKKLWLLYIKNKSKAYTVDIIKLIIILLNKEESKDIRFKIKQLMVFGFCNIEACTKIEISNICIILYALNIKYDFNSRIIKVLEDKNV